jgi:hypothetical protein
MNLAHHTSQMRARLPAQFLKMGKSNPLAIFYPKFAQKAAFFRANWHRVPVNSDLVTSKIFDIQNTLEIQLFQTKKRALRTRLDTLDFRADRNFG